MNNSEINKFSEEHGINRYELVIATAKCARMITDDFVRQKEISEKLAGKDVEIPVIIDESLRDEKPVQSAVEMLTEGEFRIIEETLPENTERAGKA